MQTTSYTQIVLKADEGYWLYNKKESSFAKTVYLGKDASSDDWSEISNEEYEKLLAEIEKDIEL